MYNLLTPIEIDEILQKGSAWITQYQLEQLGKNYIYILDLAESLEAELIEKKWEMQILRRTAAKLQETEWLL